MYSYPSYDAWKTENPWDGQARMMGFKDEEDMIRHMEHEEEDSDDSVTEIN